MTTPAIWVRATRDIADLVGSNNANNAGASNLVVANADGSILERLELIQAILAGTVGIASFPAAAAPANDVSIVEVIRDLWDVNRNGTGGSEPGTNRSIIDEIKGSALNYNAVNYLAVTADMSSATWNTVATHEVFTVTGMVRMRVIVECTATLTDAADGATISLGVATAGTSWISATNAAGASGTTISTGELWIDTSPTEVEGNFSSVVLDKVVAGGLDVGYAIASEALTGGTLVFHCWWESLNATGAVVAGAGGTL